MHRFRKKSDAKRGEVPAYHPGFSPSSSPSPQQQPSYPIITQHVVQYPPPPPPSLPPISDFRTSLILPDLSRRFTLLRSTNASAVNLDDLRYRFAEQRAKGAENQISEEEEDMLLEMLSRIRTQGGSSGNLKQHTKSPDAAATMRKEPSQGSLSSSDAPSTVRQSTQSTTTVSSAGYEQPGSMSPTSRGSKRHSNQLFAGGQLRDLRTMRKTSNRTISSNRSGLSSAVSELSTSGSVANVIDFYSDNAARPATPENTSPPLSTTSSPVSPIRNSSVSSAEDILGPLPSTSNLRLKKDLTNNQIHRISMSLDDALKGIEEEAEDQVLVPRTSTSVQGNGSGGEKNAFALTTDDSTILSPVAVTGSSNAPFTATTMTDAERPGSAGGCRSPSPYQAGGSVSPVPRVPGYIPGMPRPVTPHREHDIEDVRSMSITPRAASSSISGPPISSPTPSLHRQAVTSPSPYGSRPKSPHSSVRQGGRATPDERASIATSDHAPLSSHWRRPSSPLSTNSNAFQSLNGGSRPSTPSNVTWNVSPRSSAQVHRPLARNGTPSGHNRNGSASSIGDTEPKDDRTDQDDFVLRSPKPVYKTAEDEETRPKFLSNGSSLSASGLSFIDFDPAIGTNPLPLSPTPPVHRTKSPATPALPEDTGRPKKSVSSHLLTPPTSPFASKFNDSNPLILSSTSNNSSRSSLVSLGSSYHSWEEENGTGGLFVPIPGGQELAWHDIPSSSNLSTHSRSQSRSQEFKDDPETILRQHTGLTKTDLLTIQGKLVDASEARARNADVRASSTLRRRRPSTAQSIHSTGQPSRTTSPAPVFSTQWGAPSENTAKASALLDSVLDSLRFRDEVEKSEDFEISFEPPVIPTLTQLSTSSPGRRNKDLADVLFGSGEADHEPLPSVIDSEPSPLGEGIPFYNYEKPSVEDPASETQRQTQAPSAAEHLSGDKLGPVIPDLQASEQDQSELMRQVQERTEAAMAQLKKSPQQTRFPSLPAPGTRKKIHLQDISNPHLIQSSTSIDKLPAVPVSPAKAKVQQAEAQRTIKFSLTKRLRSTLKSKPSQPNGEEVTPWTLDNNSSVTFSNSPHASHQNLAPPKSNLQSSGSNSDNGNQPKGVNVSPPASAGPNLKTFMSRFRKKGQEPPTQKNYSMPPPSNVNGRRSFQLHPSASPLRRSGSVSQTQDVKPIMAPAMSREQTERPPSPGSMSSQASPPGDPHALKQFYEAAQNLGLDQFALNEFLSRSGSLTSKPSVKRVNPPLYDDDPNDSDRVQSPVIPEVFVDHQGSQMSRSNTMRQSTSSRMSAVPRRVREMDGQSNARNTILRRTLIFPSAPNGSLPELPSPLPSKRTSKSAKRTSNLSVQSGRSLIDRVPTPPPSKVKRQSVEPSPPMPNSSWVSLGRPSMSRSPPVTPIDQSRSPYESFYEMYSGDRSGSTEPEQPKTPEDGLPEVEEGQALEVIELANGETIWSIVNGLRAEDTESLYQRRASFDSEYSYGQPGDGDTEQLFFKEHNHQRTGSKSSNSSHLNRRRSHQAAANRPETKVFYSSSAHIARLIESLSQSTEAATFNIKPREGGGLTPDFGAPMPQVHIPGHSHSNSVQTDSEVNFTVEEHLDRMIDHVNADR